jgi:hypothetical protein
MSAQLVAPQLAMMLEYSNGIMPGLLSFPYDTNPQLERKLSGPKINLPLV